LPSVFYQREQIPGPTVGRNISDVPAGVKSIYEERRRSMAEGSYTGALLLGRKLIMHLAVDVAGADEGETFAAYVDYLKSSGYIPPSGDKLLEYIKALGNEKNHELKVGTKEEASRALRFVEALLIFMYEFPAEYEEQTTDDSG
jgi:hypothetical protein